ELVEVQKAALVNVVNRAQQALFQFAARVNPLYFAGESVVSQVSGGWARPANAESVLRIEGMGSSQTVPTIFGEVLLAPFDDRASLDGTPSVYRRGGRVYSSGNVGDPVAG